MKLTCLSVVAATLLIASPGSAQQDPLNHPLLCIDEPHEGGAVGQTFGIRGSALNSPFVHVWAFPAGSAPVWLGSANASAPDPLRKMAGGVFSLHVTGAPIGNYPVVVYAYEPATGGFPTYVVLPMQVHACQAFTVSWPFYGVTGATLVPMPYCG